MRIEKRRDPSTGLGHSKFCYQNDEEQSLRRGEENEWHDQESMVEGGKALSGIGHAVLFQSAADRSPKTGIHHCLQQHGGWE